MCRRGRLDWASRRPPVKRAAVACRQPDSGDDAVTVLNRAVDLVRNGPVVGATTPLRARRPLPFVD